MQADLSSSVSVLRISMWIRTTICCAHVCSEYLSHQTIYLLKKDSSYIITLQQKKYCGGPPCLIPIYRTYSRVPDNRPPSPLPPIVNFLIFFHPGHPYSNLPCPPPFINFQSFLSVNSHFHQVHHKEKGIVQSSTITMNYVNTKHMFSL